VTAIGKATEKGLEEVGKTVLRQHFQFSGDEEKEDEHPAPSVSEYLSQTSLPTKLQEPHCSFSLGMVDRGEIY
jgi:hypothetical protein